MSTVVMRGPATTRLRTGPGTGLEEETELDWERMEGWTTDEVEWWLMGPFDGEVPGLVRRIRRILDVSQRGLAALIGVSQSVVARWETGRTSPRAAVLLRLLRMAEVGVELHDVPSGEEVEPMRDDGARDLGGRRFPAHVDLKVTGWWTPKDSLSDGSWPRWTKVSRSRETVRVRYHLKAWKRIFRDVHGTPVDHPSDQQHVAEAHHMDEAREERLRRRAA
ncbi:XRE family transcriptional regulator [Nocardioides oleivorans]|uniref:XRE family transcriptional regulator n=1 Tax=Nocardioides oleivorans TaxID=273676 RepID=A0A4V1RKS2_9ACTN|nr:helix-turn-helix transcriptional regulator [Nocardioides oleivorans]RYB93272.1 XRE family transcriptional regulator [Nocardioides oleivorans]